MWILYDFEIFEKGRITTEKKRNLTTKDNQL